VEAATHPAAVPAATPSAASGRAGASRAARIGRAVARGPLNILLAVVSVLWLLPTLGLLFTSLLPSGLISTSGWWKVIAHPHLLTFANYNAILKNDDIVSALWTTVEISVGNTLLLVLVAAMAGYAFAWMKFPGRDILFVVVIALLVVPLQTALIPIFSLYESTGLFDTVLGLILFHVAFGLPFGIFLMRNFFVGIPKDIMESARIDGASELRIFLKLILPLGLPAIASLAIFQFLWTWNDLIVALTYGRDVQPLTVAIFSQTRQFGSNIELIAPASFISLVIPLGVFLAFQRYFVQGMLAGSVK
jgi:alpha-glucoside transport system permease protein